MDKALLGPLDPVEVMEDKDPKEVMVPLDQLDLQVLLEVPVDKVLKDPQGTVDKLDQLDLLELLDLLEVTVDKGLLEQLDQLDQLVHRAQQPRWDLVPLSMCLDPRQTSNSRVFAQLIIQSVSRVEELVLRTT